MTETLINAIPFILLAGGLAWYLYEQDKKIREIREHTFRILNSVMSMEINHILESIRYAKEAGDEKAAEQFMERIQERMEFLSDLNGRDITEFVKVGIRNNSTEHGQQDIKQENG